MTRIRSGRSAAVPSPLRRRYWRLVAAGRRTLRNAALQVRLCRLGWRARLAGRRRGGTVRLAGYLIRYDDPLSLYMEYKHIFGWGIYDFRCRSARPLVLDCGSHIGLSVLRFKRLVPDARVIAFEPDPGARRLLAQNLRNNCLHDVEVVPAAVTGRRGTCRFVADGSDGGARLAGDQPGAGQIEVPTVALSAYLDEPVELLKLNIEGSEADALLEAEPKLRNVRQVVLEYHGFPELGQRLHEILGLLDRRGFRYLLHHFDYQTNPALRPPLRARPASRFFLLVAATRLGAATGSPDPNVSPARQAERPAGANPPGPAPLSRRFGLERGQPIDRCYIEAFLHRFRHDIRGRVLEVGDDRYSRQFGTRHVRQVDVLSPEPAPGTTLVGDLTRPARLPPRRYDCLILTQVLPFLFDLHAAVQGCHRLLRPGGVLLVTVPGISQLSRYDQRRWGDYWRFTPAGLSRLLAACFRPEALRIISYGNVRSASALLHGRAAHELSAAELGHRDEDYPLIIAGRAVRDG